ncbi:PC-esterase domain-containing protein 1A-like [Aplochiton taeniatus]
MVVNHYQAKMLLNNKFVVILGGSVQRSIYKDLVLLLQKEKYLSNSHLKTKGELSFEQDCLVEGGRLWPMTNGTEYREVRQFRTDHHLVRFYFLTRLYSPYMESVLQDFRHGLKPDVILINSCIWDVSRYNRCWVTEYRENLHKVFEQIHSAVNPNCLILWNMAMPVGKKIIGGFLVPEIAHVGPTLRYDVIEANFYSAKLANAYGLDVLDLHFQFRLYLEHRMGDGVHWDALAHRRITTLVLQHVAQAWGVRLHAPRPASAPCHTDEGTRYSDNAHRGESQMYFGHVMECHPDQCNPNSTAYKEQIFGKQQVNLQGILSQLDSKITSAINRREQHRDSGEQHWPQPSNNHYPGA